jgi:hypothetical protein
MEIKWINEVRKDHINPQMARDKVMLLDGQWQCNGHSIQVPYPPEAELSGYEDRAQVLSEDWDGKLNYSCTFVLPEDFTLPVVLLHFGAVDQVCDVYVDDVLAGRHSGGYLAFSFNISELLQGWPTNRRHSLRVEVTDTLSHAYPYGKQRKDRGGMWYTPVSGIWKSVWLENVPTEYVIEWKILPDLNGFDLKAVMNTGKSHALRLDIDDPHWWSPEDPYLYPMHVEIGEDAFDSYGALRTISIRKVEGIQRVCLNEQPVFLHGVLDQGYWPDGLYTPATPQCYDRDILAMKELGFNLLRKHCKVEPAYFYCACDRLGMLVCQDMVQSGGYHYWRDTVFPTLSFKKRNDTHYPKGTACRREPGSQWKDAYNDSFRRKFFLNHCLDTMKELQNYPCVIMYTIFNEGWGQFDSDRAYELLKNQDSSRLFDSTSGWFAQKKSDFDSEHCYFRNRRLHPKQRPMFLKECGGYSLDPGRLRHQTREETKAQKSSTYGYGACQSPRELTERIRKLYEVMVLPAIPEGLCGCIYTQLSDVEDEINGMYTYDRKHCKVIKEGMQKIAKMVKKEM